ncbi:MAG: SPOR domain-containing protein [Bacteriovoracaceae bacterium]
MMEDNNKLFVFEKKEVVLIFVFIVVIAVTAFTLGVRIGKQLSLKEEGFTAKEVQDINLKSVDEEYVESVVDEGANERPQDFEGALQDREDPQVEPNVESAAEVEARLREEMEKLAAGDIDEAGGEGQDSQAEPVIETAGSEEQIQNYDELYAPSDNVEGKFTIQLYSNQSKAAAEDFADAFIVKGYDVIINEADIPGKGNWYRVSIGLFDTLEDAKRYLEKEQGLFQGEDYIIQKL